jgi:uncharacterized repeat protein (TIGR01451 family)
MAAVALMLLAPPAGASTAAGSAVAAADPQTRTFSTPGQQVTWTVPPGVTQVLADAVGAAGGTDAGGNGCVPGHGGEVTATVPVTPGQTLTLLVGGAGGNASGGQGGAAGAAGGGAGGSAGATEFASGGGGGGGGSSVSAPGARLVVAGGGGGCAGSANGSDGDGGNDGFAGQDGHSAKGGGAGTQTAAGAGGASAPSTDASGTAGSGAVGGAGAGSASVELGGGGGGGGYFGGGGGGATAVGQGIAGGGGGGGDFVIAGATGTHENSGVGTGDGRITLTYTLSGTTVGQVFTPSRSLPCVSQTPCGDYLQLGVSTGSRYTVPFDGVITSWSFQADASPPVSSTAFIVARACCGTRGFYTTVGAAPASAVTANELNSYPARIQVRAGDVIGLSTGDGDFYWHIGDTEDQAAAAPRGIGVGGSASYTTQQFETDYSVQGGSRLDVSAQVEPDADGDGFGDVSQDACPGVPGSLQGCPQADLSVTQSTSATSVPAGGQVTYSLAVANHGPEEAPGVVLTDSLPAGATLASATTSGGTCSFTTTVSCDLGTLAPAASATVTITVQLTRAGTAVSTARVDSSVLDSAHAKVPGAGDTNPANDANTANVAVTSASSSTPTGGSAPQGAGQSSSPPTPTVPFAGVTLPSHTITVTGRDALVLLRSQLAATGSLTLTTTVTVPTRGDPKRPARHRTIVIGHAAFALSAGNLKQVRVHLTGQALALLHAHRGLEVLATVVARDTFRTSRTTHARLSLELSKKPKRD